MPVSRFFLFAQEARRGRASEWSELTDIAALPLTNANYYKNLKTRYRILFEDDMPAELPKKPTNAVVMDAASREAKESVMSIMASLRSGYG